MKAIRKTVKKSTPKIQKKIRLPSSFRKPFHFDSEAIDCFLCNDLFRLIQANFSFEKFEIQFECLYELVFDAVKKPTAVRNCFFRN